MKIGSRVSWIETYRTHANVVHERQMWGTVVSLVDHTASNVGFPQDGDYVLVEPLGGEAPAYVRQSVILLVQEW